MPELPPDFTSLGLAEPILRALEREGLTTPTPIQAQAIPPLMQHRDLVGVAQTGTGKTAAFALPVLHALVTDPRNREKRKGKTTRMLVLSPTRELAQQIGDAFRTFGRFTSPRSAVVVGGVRPGPQIKAMAGGLDILIATPGRLEDHMREGAIRMDQVSMVVLDEADQMLDLGFAPAIRRILAKTPHDRQTLLFSATMPKGIRELAQDYLDDPVEVSVTPQSTPVERIAQSVVRVDQKQKRDALAYILSRDDVKRAIIFTRTKRGADRVGKQLGLSKIEANVIHGDKGQGQRQRALAELESGKTPILVATDIAARGIDVDGITHVVNYDMPHVPEAYVHRIGRTARAGASGVAVSLVNSDERKLLRDIEKLIGFTIDAHSAIPGLREAPPEERDASPSSDRRGAKPGGRSGAKPGGRGGAKAKGPPRGSDGTKKRGKKRKPSVRDDGRGETRAERPADGARPQRRSKPGGRAGEGASREGAPKRRTGRPGRKSNG